MPGHAVCGTETGYRRHRAERTFTCRRCCTAHAAVMARWRSRARVTTAVNPVLYQAARLGLEPAEALVTADRHRLVAELHRLGWDDIAIASLSRMTLYTTARIRGALGLLPNRPGAMEGAA